jgi:hypothetical protein
LVEQLTLNQRVPGSSPGAPTIAGAWRIAGPWSGSIIAVLRVTVLSGALAACAAASTGPLEPGTVQARMSGEVHSFVSVGAGATR